MNRINQEHAKNYLLSGRAFITMHNTQSASEVQSQFSYVVKQKKLENSSSPKPLFYVYDNNNDYLGFIRNDIFKPGEGDRILILRKNAVQNFIWLWDQIITQTLPDHVHILHSGKCGRCGRPLTDAWSIKTGIGPDCREELGIPDPKKHFHLQPDH